jgi:murein DD-endopeptidase MepM/ murein hydrolase activator NlpD
MKHLKQPFKIRKSDNHGQGHFLAPRGKKKHKGIDIICDKGDYVLSISKGEVTKIGYPYSQSVASENWPANKIEKFNRKKALRYVQVTDEDGFKVRYFYVSPVVHIGSIVDTDQVLGNAQELGKIYQGITGHIHFEVFDPEGRVFDPNEYIQAKLVERLNILSKA